MLLVLVAIVATTGFLSHAAYQPDLRRQRDRRPRRDLPLIVRLAGAASRFLYAITQGLHVNVGLVAIPFLLAKLWSVIPRLFAWPPVAVARAGARAAVDRAARRERGVRVRHRA